jgi:hypothetical protein
MANQTNLTTTLKPQPDVSVQITEYDPETGQPSRQLDSINLDRTTPSEQSTPIVIKMNVIGVDKISNIRLGLVKSSETVSGSGSQADDGSVPSGNIGIEHSSSLVEKILLTSFFNGTNQNGVPASTNNIKINNSSRTESEFIYLNVTTPNAVKRGFLKFKWFFDFS